MIIDSHALWTFSLLWIAVVPTPGANTLMVTHVAMTRSPAHVALAIAGNMCGIVLLAAGALLGWAAFLETFPWARRAVSILGAAYLVYFGVMLLGRGLRAPALASIASTSSTSGTPRDVAAPRLRRSFALGFLTAVSNGQAIAFITGIYVVTGVLAANIATGLASVAIMVVCNATYLGLIGWLFRRERVRIFYAAYRRWIEGAVGALFVGLGGRLLWREFVR